MLRKRKTYEIWEFPDGKTAVSFPSFPTVFLVPGLYVKFLVK